jgi:hypothetical protein
MGGKGPSQGVTQTEQQLIGEDINIAQQQQTNANTLFTEIGLPGLQTAQSYYNKLASGDPKAIQAAVGPAEAGIDTQTAGTVANIKNTSPRGGTEQLAEEEAKIAGAGQKGNLVTQAYTSAFPALANLGSGTTGLSQSAIAQALQGFQGASSTVGQLGQQQEAGKASSLAFFGALAGAGGEVAGAACWIAARIFGFSDVRTYMVRAWLRRVFSQRFAGRILMPLYRRYGRQAARSEWLCERLKPLFEMALRCATREMLSPSLGLGV